jgi:hypothetical protein
MAINYQINRELHKYKILSIPRFNEETLEFEVDKSMP